VVVAAEEQLSTCITSSCAVWQHGQTSAWGRHARGQGRVGERG